MRYCRPLVRLSGFEDWAGLQKKLGQGCRVLRMGVALVKACAGGAVMLLRGCRYTAAQSSALTRKVVLPAQPCKLQCPSCLAVFGEIPRGCEDKEKARAGAGRDQLQPCIHLLGMKLRRSCMGPVQLPQRAVQSCIRHELLTAS